MNNETRMGKLLQWITNYDRKAAKASLLCKGPILYLDEARFPGKLLREWPDGRIEIVRLDVDGKLVVVKEVASRQGKEL